LAVLRLADDDDLGKSGQQALAPLPRRLLVVRDQNP
jgi:hypothetical protein